MYFRSCTRADFYGAHTPANARCENMRHSNKITTKFNVKKSSRQNMDILDVSLPLNILQQQITEMRNREGMRPVVVRWVPIALSHHQNKTSNITQFQTNSETCSNNEK